MRTKTFVRFTVLGMVASLIFIFLYAFSSSSSREHMPTKECTNECCQKKPKIQDNDLMLETFSRELIFILN